jgi:hypothetical protein
MTMMQNPRSIIEMSLNSASMAAFMLPGPGPALGVALMAAPLIMNLFFPVEESLEFEDALPTNADLTNALAKLRNDLTKDLFDSELTKAHAQLVTLYSSIEKVWVASIENEGAIAPDVARGPMFLSDVVTNEQERVWLERFEYFRQPIFDPNSPIRVIKTWIELHPQYSAETLPLYCFAGSIWNLYCKFNIAWEYNVILLNYRRALDEYETVVQNTNLDDALVQWHFNGKEQGEPRPELPPKPPVPEALSEIRKYSQYCRLIADYTPDFIAYAKPIATKLKEGFHSRRLNISRRLAQIELRERGSGLDKVYFYFDVQTGESSQPVPHKHVAAARLRVRQGTVRLGLEQQLTALYGLDKILEADVDAVLQTIAKWEETVINHRPL